MIGDEPPAVSIGVRNGDGSGALPKKIGVPSSSVTLLLHTTRKTCLDLRARMPTLRALNGSSCASAKHWHMSIKSKVCPQERDLEQFLFCKEHQMFLEVLLTGVDQSAACCLQAD